MPSPKITAVSRTQGNNAAIKNGTILPKGFDLQFEEVPVLPQAFRRMVRGLEFDVCEMALTTYLCAREHGVRFTALPIFLVRAFHHGAILCSRQSGIKQASDLQGKRIGVNRGYTVTTGVWARSILQEEHGVDLDKVTWALTGDEHVREYSPPSNVESLPSGSSMEDLLVDGSLAAAIGVSSDNPDLRSVIPDPLEAGIRAFQDRGHYPINHLIVVRDDVLEENPEIAVALFDAFSESKHIYLDQLRNDEITEPTSMDKLYARILGMSVDPLPYGIEPNRRVLEELIAHATTQKILRKPADIGSLFAATTLGLTG